MSRVMLVVTGDGDQITTGLEPVEVSDQARIVAQRIADERGEPVWLCSEGGGEDEEGQRFDPRPRRQSKRTVHFTALGLSMQPEEADAQGYLRYRDGFELLPRAQWTRAERLIRECERRIAGRAP